MTFQGFHNRILPSQKKRPRQKHKIISNQKTILSTNIPEYLQRHVAKGYRRVILDCNIRRSCFLGGPENKLQTYSKLQLVPCGIQSSGVKIQAEFSPKASQNAEREIRKESSVCRQEEEEGVGVRPLKKRKELKGYTGTHPLVGLGLRNRWIRHFSTINCRVT